MMPPDASAKCQSPTRNQRRTIAAITSAVSSIGSGSVSVFALSHARAAFVSSRLGWPDFSEGEQVVCNEPTVVVYTTFDVEIIQ